MKLIIINGLPATGKTTIARPLADTLSFPLIEKDTIKEFLFDTIGVGDREWSKMLGRVSSEFLYSLADELLANNKSVIIESAFETDFARPVIERFAKKYELEIVEIYCTTEKNIRRQRFIDRNESGKRHAGHVDTVNYPPSGAAEPLQKSRPIGVGKTIMLDTSHGPINIDDLASKVVQRP